MDVAYPNLHYYQITYIRLYREIKIFQFLMEYCSLLSLAIDGYGGIILQAKMGFIRLILPKINCVATSRIGDVAEKRIFISRRRSPGVGAISTNKTIVEIEIYPEVFETSRERLIFKKSLR